jgi:hypothetical protein
VGIAGPSKGYAQYHPVSGLAMRSTTTTTPITSQPLYCSSERLEDCSTGTPPVATDTYAWLSENPMWQDCTNGCTLNIPAISGRVLYYVIDRNAAGRVTSSSLQCLAVQEKACLAGVHLLHTDWQKVCNR